MSKQKTKPTDELPKGDEPGLPPEGDETTTIGGDEGSSNDPPSPPADERKLFHVSVEKIKPATIAALDEDEAREKYRRLRGFVSTKMPWTVVSVGSIEDATAPLEEPPAEE